MSCCITCVAHRRTIGADVTDDVSGTSQPAPTDASSSAAPAFCAYAAPMGAPIAAPMKTLFAPNAPMSSEIAQRDNQKTHALGEVCVISAGKREVIGTHRRIGAIGAEPPPHADPMAEPDEVLV